MPDPQRPSPLNSSLDGMTGRRLPGGCDDCNAYQTMTRAGGGLYLLTTHHDDTCPALAASEEAAKALEKGEEP
jgi:hypothetical protein